MRIDSKELSHYQTNQHLMLKLSAATGQNFNGNLIVFNIILVIITMKTNGRFTAPADGRYLFCWYTNVDTNSKVHHYGEIG